MLLLGRLASRRQTPRPPLPAGGAAAGAGVGAVGGRAEDAALRPPIQVPFLTKSCHLLLVGEGDVGVLGGYRGRRVGFFRVLLHLLVRRGGVGGMHCLEECWNEAEDRRNGWGSPAYLCLCVCVRGLISRIV